MKHSELFHNSLKFNKLPPPIGKGRNLRYNSDVNRRFVVNKC